MNRKEIFEKAAASQEAARKVLESSRIAEIWRQAGCRVNIVGSLRMGLLASHRDIDLHVYSTAISTRSSFGIMALIAEDPRVTEIKCINGLNTDEHCVAWHLNYRAENDESWQIDIIHIEEGTQYDGFFERMADRIKETMTPEERFLILKLKFDTPQGYDFHGVEYYEAVIADKIRNMEEFKVWVDARRKKKPYYWIP